MRCCSTRLTFYFVIDNWHLTSADDSFNESIRLHLVNIDIFTGTAVSGVFAFKDDFLVCLKHSGAQDKTKYYSSNISL